MDVTTLMCAEQALYLSACAVLSTVIISLVMQGRTRPPIQSIIIIMRMLCCSFAVLLPYFVAYLVVVVHSVPFGVLFCCRLGFSCWRLKMPPIHDVCIYIYIYIYICIYVSIPIKEQCLFVGLLVCLLVIGHTTFVHFAALPPSRRESRSRRRGRPRALGQAHAQRREHARMRVQLLNEKM